MAESQEKYSLRFRFLLWIGPALFVWLIKFICRTSKVTIFGKEIEDRFLQEGEVALYAGWHQCLLYYVYHFRNRQGVIMTSQSKDGEVIAGILHRLGLIAARGSSSRGGSNALSEMIDLVKKGHTAGLVVDAPRGPAYVAKSGIISLAKETQAPLIPVMAWAKRKILFKSWDRTMFPLPFNHIVFFYGEPILVPKDADAETREKYRRQLEDTLREMDSRAKSYFGDDTGNSHPSPR